MDSKPALSVSIPGAIIIAGAIVAVAIIWTKQAPAAVVTPTLQGQVQEIAMAPITSEDHILGNPNAAIKIVEYSDTSCPFCKTFHPTMKQVMAEYGETGKVAWVYRHFPLDKEGTRSDGGILHPNAGHEAQALECAAALGGNDTFWKYTHRLYEITPSEQGQPLDQAQLPEIARYAGLDAVSFNECLTSNRFKDKVEAQYQDGLAAGVTGTPFSILVTASGSKVPLTGAQSYTTLKSAIDALLAQEK